MRSSLFGWIAPAPKAVADRAKRLEAIRHAMLSALSELDATRFPDLGRRLRIADDFQTLWYARSELMHAMASRMGESHAKAQMAVITDMFEGLVSPGIAPRNRRR